MNNGYASRIRERISASTDGTIFINSDFTDIADNETVRRNLNRLTKNGVIRRIINGLYEKPKYSRLLEEYVAPDPHEVAKAIARGYHWTIFPSGESALNKLGLSTQVTAAWSYVSDGPYRTYEWGNTKLEFRHRENKEISGLSCTSGLVIQALKALGKTNITPAVTTAISRRLSADEKHTLMKEGRESTSWVFAAIKEICRERTIQ